MKAVSRSVAAVLAGFVAASVVMMIVEFVNGKVLHPDLAKAAEGVTDREVLRGIIASAPVSALLVVVFGWALGSFVGGWATARIAARAQAAHALVLGVLLTLAGVANNLMMPPPLWFWCASFVVFIPMAILGFRVAPRKG